MDPTSRQPALSVLPDGWPTHVPFTRRQANAAGISDSTLRRLCLHGHLRRPLRGVYVDALTPDTLTDRAEALRLVVPPGCFVTDRTAAWLHGAESALAPREHLAVPPVSMFRLAGSDRLRNGLVSSGERTVSRRDLTLVHGILATTPVRTALDLGRLQRRDVALGGMDALARSCDVTPHDLLAELPRFRGARGVVQLRELAPLVDGRAQSPGESALRLRWLDAGLPEPDLQVAVRRPDGGYFYLDLGIRALRFAAEYDGALWHQTRAQRERDGARRAWLRDVADWTIVVVGGEEVHGDQKVFGILATAYRRHLAQLRLSTPA